MHERVVADGGASGVRFWAALFPVPAVCVDLLFSCLCPSPFSFFSAIKIDFNLGSGYEMGLWAMGGLAVSCCDDSDEFFKVSDTDSAVGELSAYKNAKSASSLLTDSFCN